MMMLRNHVLFDITVQNEYVVSSFAAANFRFTSTNQIDYN